MLELLEQQVEGLIIWEINDNKLTTLMFCHPKAKDLLSLPKDVNIESSDFLDKLNETKFV